MRKAAIMVVALVFVFVAAMAYAERAGSLNEIFMATCFGCHDTGMMDAPVAFGGELNDRVKASGFDAVMKNAMQGLGDMPAKGSCEDCTEAQIKALIEYMMRPSP